MLDFFCWRSLVLLSIIVHIKFSHAFINSLHVTLPKNLDSSQVVLSAKLRRNMISGFISIFTSVVLLEQESGAQVFVDDDTESSKSLSLISDPDTYSGLIYTPPKYLLNDDAKLPLIVFLHGAGKNKRDAWNLADIKGEHAGLIPSLISSGVAPKDLTNNFAMVAPYSEGKASLYEASYIFFFQAIFLHHFPITMSLQDPRRKVLDFIDWVSGKGGQNAGIPPIDPNRIYLFGFSDGATLTVELLTTGRFKAGVIAAYGFTGTLPQMALDRLKGIPMWIFHSADDVIFPIKCSDNLVMKLREVNGESEIIKYSRFESDQEGFTGRVRGHSTGITASKNPEVYKWLLSLY